MPTQTPVTTAVVYVHGLWRRGSESIRLRRCLARELDAEVHVFSYPTLRGPVDDHAAALQAFLYSLNADRVHLVAYSLGGLVLLRFFERLDAAGGLIAPGRTLPPGRVVLLGSPVQGSHSARRLARLPFGKRLLGRTAHEVLVGASTRRWQGGRELGIIAGHRSVGLGRVLGPLPGLNDGTVCVDETTLEGATDTLILRLTHSGIPFSALVARHTAAFLRDGRFAIG